LARVRIRTRTPEQRRAEWRRRSTPDFKAARRAHYASSKGRWREWALKKYGLSLEEFRAILRGQGNRCAICRATGPGGTGDWNVDHDHATGVVRGVLCVLCNLMLGKARDNPEILRMAAGYLEAPTRC